MICKRHHYNFIHTTTSVSEVSILFDAQRASGACNIFRQRILLLLNLAQALALLVLFTGEGVYWLTMYNLGYTGPEAEQNKQIRLLFCLVILTMLQLPETHLPINLLLIQDRSGPTTPRPFQNLLFSFTKKYLSTIFFFPFPKSPPMHFMCS